MDIMLLKVKFIMHILAFLWVSCALILILVILLQKGRGGGLSGALGGGMASGILGTKTGDFLTWVTVTLVGVFLLLSITLAKFYRPHAAAETPMTAAPQTQSRPIPQQAQVPVETTLPADEGQPLDQQAELENMIPQQAGTEVNLPR